MAEFAALLAGSFSMEAILSGTAAGTTAILVGQPLDTIKVRQQCGQTVLENYNPRTILSLYRGFMPPLVTNGLVTAGMFSVFEACNAVTKSTFYADSKNLPLTVHFASGTVAGAALSVITCPTSILKVQQQFYAGEISLKDCARKLIRKEGMRGLFRGFGPHLYAEAIGKAVYMHIYEVLKRQMDPLYASGESKTTATSKRVMAGAGAGVACWAAIYPTDVVRSRMHAQSCEADACSLVTSRQVARELYAKGGWRAFFRGFTPTVLRAGPVAAVALPTYDITFQYLRRFFE